MPAVQTYFDAGCWLQKVRVIIRISNNCKQRETPVAQVPKFFFRFFQIFFSALNALPQNSSYMPQKDTSIAVIRYRYMDHTMVKSVLFLLWWINDNKQERETVSARADHMGRGAEVYRETALCSHTEPALPRI